MTETSMIERVARAMLAAHDHTTNDGAVGGFETMTPDWQDVYRAMARAAIEAMREPTKEMVLEIAAADWKGTSDLNWSDGWRIMIDAALSQAIGNKESGDV